MDEQSFLRAQEMFRKMSEDPERPREFKLLTGSGISCQEFSRPYAYRLRSCSPLGSHTRSAGLSLSWAQVLTSPPLSPRYPVVGR